MDQIANANVDDHIHVGHINNELNENIILALPLSPATACQTQIEHEWSLHDNNVASQTGFFCTPFWQKPESDEDRQIRSCLY